MKRIVVAFALAASLAAFAQAPAPVTVQGAWARAVLQGQSNSGGYMTLLASEPLALVGASSPLAGTVEIHEMRMEGDVMRMRAVDRIDLPAGKAVELKPGGYHLMLMDLKAPFRADTRVPVTLRFRDAGGQSRTLDVALPVVSAAPHGGGHGAAHGATHGAGHGHGR